MHIKLGDILYFLFVSVVVKAIVAQWLAVKFRKLLSFIFIRSQKDIIVWTHYKKRAMKSGHSAKTPEECEDEKCVVIKSDSASSR